MSIISDALKKVSDKRKSIVRLPEESDADLSYDIKEMAPKKPRWNLPSTIATVFIAGFAIVAFLYSTNLLTLSTPQPKQLAAAPDAISTQELRAIDVKVAASPAGDKIIKPVSAPVSQRPRLKAVQRPTLTLNGVVGGIGEPMAVIENEILRKGDFVQGAQIIDIGSDRVTLRYDDGEVTLHIE